MRKVIYKYSISSTDSPDLMAVAPGSKFTIPMRKGAEILSLQAQAEFSVQGIPQVTGKLWAMLDPSEIGLEDRFFALIQTGQEFEIEKAMKYIGTYELHGGLTVLHLFEYI